MACTEKLDVFLWYQNQQKSSYARVFMAGVSSILLLTCPVRSQIVPDATLPVNSTVPGNCTVCTIEGGTVQGTNLFHSFSQFSVPLGGVAYFNNAAGIQNIITRITGLSSSNIEGLIRSNGTANLFLLNPNGMTLGANARLAIDGSFLASTANRLLFADGSQLRAGQPGSNPLLTVTAPVGLGLDHSEAGITVVGAGHGLRVDNPLFSPVLGAGQSATGLRVTTGRTISLIGGRVSFVGGLVTAPSGQIQLAGVKRGEVFFAPTVQGFDYGKVQQFGPVSLVDKSLVDTSGQSGQIQLTGDQVLVQGGSAALIQNQGLRDNGSLRVNASDSLTISGVDPATQFPTRLLNETVANGNAGEISVTAPEIRLTQGAQITTRTYTASRGGNIVLNAANQIQADGMASNPNLFSFAIAGTAGSGRSGDVTVTSPFIELSHGAGVGSVTLASGDAGNVSVDSRSINLMGETPAGFSSALLSSTGGTGNAGRVDIITSILRMSDGANISSSTGAQGDANSINIQASDLIDIRGISRSNPGFLTGISSSANRQASFLSRVFNLPTTQLGNAGNISLSTRTLMLSEGGAITVLEAGRGLAGAININADLVRIRQGQVSAASNGSGGNINIRANSFQIISDLKPPSRVAFAPVPFTYSRLTAGSLETGNGGNIQIQAQTFLSVNGFIRATARDGTGGRVEVTAKGVFLSRDSLVTATSALGPQFDGLVQLNAPEVDLTRATAVIPTVTNPPPISSACGAQIARTSSFTQTGTGGLPRNPEQQQSSQRGWQESVPSPVPLTSLPSPTPEIVEAQGWVTNRDGSIQLVANVASSPPSFAPVQTTSCLPTAHVANP